MILGISKRKFIISLCLMLPPFSTGAKVLDSLDQLFAGDTSQVHPMGTVLPKPKKFDPNKKIDFLKDKKGNLKVSWNVLGLHKPGKKDKELNVNIKTVLSKSIVIKGFMIPLDYSAKRIKEFLLVPYIPTCDHYPPPPPNMIINAKVMAKKSVKQTYWPIKVTGRLSLAKTKKAQVDPFIPNGTFNMVTTSIRELKQ